jgi:hypothetical protein
MLEAGQALSLVGFDTSNPRQTSIFRFTMGMRDTDRVLGPFSPRLDNAAATIQLMRPATLTAGSPDPVPLIPVDSARYESSSPWPGSAAGAGNALERTDPDEYGILPVSWIAAAPSPGRVNFPGRRSPGDVNGDSQMDQSDIAQVLASGKYNTGQRAEWSEGDWTGDGRFDQADIVLALQQGYDVP